MTLNSTQVRLQEANTLFTPATPVRHPEFFAGRQAEIRRVQDAIGQEGRHAIIFGERGVGKTSLARVTAAIVGLTAETTSTPVAVAFVTAGSADTFTSVWDRVIEEVEFQVTHVDGVGFGAEIKERVKSLRDIVGSVATVEDVRRAGALMAGGGLQLVAFIDEFDKLGGGQDDFADTIKLLSDHALPVTCVLVGVGEDISDLLAAHASIGRNLAQVQMSRMSGLEIQQIIETRMEKLGLEIDPTSLRQIVGISQGLPHYAHLLGLNAARVAIRAGAARIASGELREALRIAVEDADRSLADHYERAVESARPEALFRHVLTACAIASKDGRAFRASDVKPVLEGIVGKPMEYAQFQSHLNKFSSDSTRRVLRRTGKERNYRYTFVEPLVPPYVVLRGLADGLLDRDRDLFLT